MLSAAGHADQCCDLVEHDQKHTAAGNGFLVAVQRNFRPPSSVTTGRIILVDFDNRFIITEDPNNIRNQTKFIITNTTTINNRFGAPVRFSALQPGQMARITHANFQTASIPPQTTAFNIQLL